MALEATRRAGANFRWRTPSRRYRRAWYSYCLFRVCWETTFPDSFVGDGRSFSNKLSVGFSPQWFKWDHTQGTHDFELYVLGLRIHYAFDSNARIGGQRPRARGGTARKGTCLRRDHGGRLCRDANAYRCAVDGDLGESLRDAWRGAPPCKCDWRNARCPRGPGCKRL